MVRHLQDDSPPTITLTTKPLGLTSNIPLDDADEDGIFQKVKQLTSPERNRQWPDEKT